MKNKIEKYANVTENIRVCLCMLPDNFEVWECYVIVRDVEIKYGTWDKSVVVCSGDYEKCNSVFEKLTNDYEKNIY